MDEPERDGSEKATEELPGGGSGGLTSAAQMREQTERFRAYLRERLQATGVSKRKLSLAMGRDPSYVAQLLDPPRTGPRALPSPAELRKAAPLLGVPLMELIEHAWGITRVELEVDLQAIAAHQGTWAADLFELNAVERAEVLNFIAFTKAKRKEARQSGAATRTDSVAAGEASDGSG